MTMDDLFGGKVMGMPKKEPEVEKDVVSEAKEYNDKIFGNIMTGGGFRQMVGIQDNSGGGFEKMLTMPGSGKKGKKIDVSAMLGSGSRKKGKSAAQSILDVEKKAMEYLGTGKERKGKMEYLGLGKKRKGGKGKLIVGNSAFGDWDKDKVPNFIDSAPRNKRNPAGPAHRTFGFSGTIPDGSGGTRTAVQVLRGKLPFRFGTGTRTLATAGGESLEVFNVPAESQLDTFDAQRTLPQTLQTQPRQQTIAEKIGMGLGKVVQASGISQALKQKASEREEFAEIRSEARKEAMTEVGQARIKQIVQAESKDVFDRYFPNTPKHSVITRAVQASKGVRGGIGITGEALQQFSRDVGSAGRAAAPSTFGGDIAALTGVGGPIPFGLQALERPSGEPFALKVDELIGPGTLRRQLAEAGALPPPPSAVPVVQPQPTAFTPQAVTQQLQPQIPAQFAPEKRIISPYSKRAVSYTRGPYRKRGQPQQQQFV